MIFKKHKRLAVCTLITCLIAVAIVLWGLLFANKSTKLGDVLGYAIYSYYVTFPLTVLISGVVLGIRKTPLQWLHVLLAGILAGLMTLIVYRSPYLSAMMVGAGFATLGILLGLLVNFLKSRRQRKRNG